ncbi:hypothetical protein SKAU_G00350980 [Synaphobranchus kaupii]|uniref:Uncharacterized protein n=1 Tax=Synaphobranchus kaupii TaxID=118154 RepID=A0A9Q1EKN8_SYNKA|nr:hypothetical protein SKAU_G00350980 [Synaphobranchus kaupii]
MGLRGEERELKNLEPQSGKRVAGELAQVPPHYEGVNGVRTVRRAALHRYFPRDRLLHLTDKKCDQTCPEQQLSPPVFPTTLTGYTQDFPYQELAGPLCQRGPQA